MTAINGATLDRDEIVCISRMLPDGGCDTERMAVPRPQKELVLERLQRAMRQLEAANDKLHLLAERDLGTYAIPPYIRAAAAIAAAADESESQVAAIEELLRRAQKNR